MIDVRVGHSEEETNLETLLIRYQNIVLGDKHFWSKEKCYS